MRIEIGKELHSAFTKFGFVYLVGHGFPKDLPADVLEASRRFFEEHTVEEKVAAFPYHPVNLWGYTPPGSERLDVHKETKEEVVRQRQRSNIFGMALPQQCKEQKLSYVCTHVVYYFLLGH